MQLKKKKNVPGFGIHFFFFFLLRDWSRANATSSVFLPPPPPRPPSSTLLHLDPPPPPTPSRSATPLFRSLCFFLLAITKSYDLVKSRPPPPPLHPAPSPQSPHPRCQSIYIKSTVHEITSLKDWTVDGDALGYCLLAPSEEDGRRGEGKKKTTTVMSL